MVINLEKIRDFLERVAVGSAGKVELNYYPERKACTITWKRPRGLIEHKSFHPRYEMLLYVKQLLEDEGVEAVIGLEITQEDFLPED